jgi:hypothetical protein
MEFLRLLLRYLHIIGFAMLFGGFLAQYLAGKLRVTRLMHVGFTTMFVTGLILAAPFPSGIDLNYAKIGVKLGIAVLIGAALGTAARRGDRVSRGHFLSIGGLAAINAGVAVLWQ